MSNKKNNNLFAQVLKIISNAISWVLLVLLVIIAGFLVYYFTSTNICKSKGETCRPKISLYTIISPSMEPTINVYDVIFNVTPESGDDINVGDVITFNSTSKMYSSRIVTHRVIEKQVNVNGVLEFRTQGDNNLSPDDTYVPYENIIGKVLFKIPQLGRVQFLLTSAGGWLFIIIIPALLLIIFDILKLVKLVGAKNKVTTVIDKEKTKIAHTEEENKERKEKLRNRLAKPDKNKYRKNNAEPKNFYNTKKTRLKVIMPEIEYHGNMIFYDEEKELEKEKLLIEELINQPEEIIEQPEVSISDDNNLIEKEKTVEDIQEEKTTEQPVNPALAEIMARINESVVPEEEIEMPKLISLKEEIIPDDIDLPTMIATPKEETTKEEKNDEQSKETKVEESSKEDNETSPLTKQYEELTIPSKVVDVVVAKKKTNQKNEPVKVVGQVKKENAKKHKKKRK